MSGDRQAGDAGSRAPDLLSTPEAGPVAIRGGALRVASFAAGSLFTIAAGAILFRHLGVVDTGRYTTALSLGALVTGFTDLGLTAVGIRELATLEGERRAQLARNLLGIRLVLTIAGVAIVSAFAFVAYGALLGVGVLITGAGVLVANVQATLAVPLMAGLRLGWVSALDFGRVLVTTALVVLLVLLGANLLPFLAAPAIAALCVLVPTALIVRTDIPLLPAFELRRWRALLGPVLTYSLAVAASTLYFRIAIVLVSLLASGAQLGYFSLSFRIVEALFAIPGLLVGAAFPIFARAARDDPARLGYALSRVFEVSLIVGAWISLMLAVGAPLAVALIGGGRFAPAAPILAIAALGLGGAFVNAVWAYGMLSLHLHRLILAVALVGRRAGRDRRRPRRARRGPRRCDRHRGRRDRRRDRRRRAARARPATPATAAVDRAEGRRRRVARLPAAAGQRRCDRGGAARFDADLRRCTARVAGVPR